MTSETKCLIELEDIVSVQCRCNSCGATDSRLIENFHGIPQLCSNCNVDWFALTDPKIAAADAQAQQATERWIVQIKHIRQILKDRQVNLRLEISGIVAKP